MVSLVILTIQTSTTSGVCSTVLLDSGIDQTYSYVACGSVPTTETLLAAPTAASAPLTTSTQHLASKSAIPDQSTYLSTNSISNTTPSRDNGPLLPQATTAQSRGADNTAENNTGAIIGGVICGLALICLTIFAIVCLFRRGQRRRSESKTLQMPVIQGLEHNSGIHAENKARRYPVELSSSRRAPPSDHPVELHG